MYEYVIDILFSYLLKTPYTQPDDSQQRRKLVAVSYVGMYSCADGTSLNTLSTFQTKYEHIPITHTYIFPSFPGKSISPNQIFSTKQLQQINGSFPSTTCIGYSTFKAILSLTVRNIQQHLQVLPVFLRQLLNSRHKNVKL